MKFLPLGVVLIASLSVVWAASISTKASGNKMVCYYGSWAVYRHGTGKFDVENIDPFLCTHIVYSFTGLGMDNKIQLLDAWNDVYDNYGKGAMLRFTGLKKLNPGLTALVAIGGWNEGSERYSRMAADPAKRAIFVQSVVDFLGKYGFDGLDLDWEYPATRGGVPVDKPNYVALVRELKAALAPRGWLVTAAVSAGKFTIDAAYDIPALAQYLDLLNLMSYDYHGASWETVTGINSPLYGNPQFDKGDNIYLNTDWSLRYWISNGFPANKIALGMPLMGRGWTLFNAADNGIGSTAYNGISPGPYTQETGVWGFNEYCEKMKADPVGWTVVRDSCYLTPYTYKGSNWFSYDDRESMLLKGQYVAAMGLAGSMVWSIETDDFKGACGIGTFPLIKAIKEGMATPNPTLPHNPCNNGTNVGPTPTTSTTTTIRTTTTASTTTPTPTPSTSTTTTTRPPSANTTTSSATTTTRSTTTTTTATTTTTPKTNSTIDAESHCKKEGLNADPNDCGRFFNCVSNSSGGYTAYSQQCAPGTVFAEVILTCTYPENVPGCENYYNTVRKL